MKSKTIEVLAIISLIMFVIVCYNIYYLNKDEEEVSQFERNNSTTSISTSTDVEKLVSEKDSALDELVSEKDSALDENVYNFSTENTITLADNNTSVSGNGVKIDGDTVIINNAGTYIVTGELSNGRLVVDANGAYVKIVLNNVSINCDYSAPIYVYKAKGVMIELSEGSTNNLSDGTTYVYNDSYSSSEDEDPDATLYSKQDLIIKGNGTLNIKANYNNGITSKDTLVITGATINVTAKNNGINGKDSNTIKNAVINVKAGKDAIRSTNSNDESLGWIRVENSTIEIDSEEDGIQAETDLIIIDSNLTIKTGGGYENGKKVSGSDSFGRDFWGRWGSTETTSTATTEESAKGIKAGKNLALSNNNIIIDSKDDAIHSNDYIQIDSGTFEINTGDDGIHADNLVTINGGTITINNSYEGIEGDNIVINDGTINIVASDDGINVSGGNDGSGFGGFGMAKMNINDANGESMKPMEPLNGEDMQSFNAEERAIGRNGKMKRERISGDMQPAFTDNRQVPNENNTNNAQSSSNMLIINSGTINVNANGDGLDSNGSIEMNGGVVTVDGPTNSGNGALDYNNKFTFNGGLLFALGSSGMAQSVTPKDNIGTIFANISQQSANSKIEIKDENDKSIYEYTSGKNFSNLVFASENIVNGNTYKIYINGNLINTVTAGQTTQGFGMNGGGR